MDMEKKKEEITVDDILTDLGPFGKFHLLNYVMILFPVLLAGMYSSVYNFEAMDLKYRCTVPECEDPSIVNFSIPHGANGEPSKCHRFAPFKNVTVFNDTCSPHFYDTSTEIKCDSYVYFEEYSIVKEGPSLPSDIALKRVEEAKVICKDRSIWNSVISAYPVIYVLFAVNFNGLVWVRWFNLACQDWKRSLVGTVHNAGFFISIPLTGLLSDKFGRRLAVVFACVANGVFGVIRAFSLNYEMFIVLEFLEPALGGGVYTACFVFAMELVGPKGRVFVSLLFNTMFILGGVTVTVLSWYLQSWRYLLLIIYTPAILVFFYVWSLTESFRWLFSKGRFEEGINVLKNCERFNGVSVPKDHYDIVEKQAMQQRDAAKFESQQMNQSTFKQIFSSGLIWKRLCICSFLWASSTLVYYGLSINAIELSGNSYLNYIVVLLIEAPANVCKLICLDRFGRKKVISTAFVLTGIILIAYGYVPSGNWATTFYLGGKFFITLAYNSLYIFAAEVFPTNYRTTLLAICSTLGRIGSTLAPQTPLLSKLYEFLPTILFGVMSAITGVLVITLPETNNQKLPDSLKDAQAQDRRGKDNSRTTDNKTRL